LARELFALAILAGMGAVLAIPSWATHTRELSFQVYADERLTVPLRGPVDFGPVAVGGFSRNGTPIYIWIINTGERTFLLTNFDSESLVGKVIFSPSRPDILPGQKVRIGLLFRADFEAPIGTFVATMGMTARNEFGVEAIHLVGLVGITRPQPIPEIPAGILAASLAAALAIASALSRRVLRSLRKEVR